MNDVTLQELLEMQIDAISQVSLQPIKFSPTFCVKVQDITEEGVKILIHADGHNSHTCDFIVKGNKLTPIG